MERANNARGSQHVTTERLNHFAKCKTWPADVRGIGGVEQKEVVMGLPGRRRTGSAVSDEAIAVGSFGEGVIAFQFARIPRDVIDDPVMETAVYRGIIVRQKQREALRSARHVRPVQFGGDIGAGTAELIDLLFCRKQPSVVKVGAGDGKGMQGAP